MTSDERAFTRAICEQPTDDNARLVFADWLEEDGQAARGEFIRTQCKLAQLEAPVLASRRVTWSGCCDRYCDNSACDCLHTPAMVELRRREKEHLLYVNCKSWLPNGFTVGHGNPGPFGTNTRQADFTRGFIDQVRCSWEQWVGGDCKRCGGVGECDESDADGRTTYRGKCNACDDGRIPGIERLCWHPDATMVCGRCSGDGQAHGLDRPFEWSPDVNYGDCVVCIGSGRVPRPMPDDAIPVTLTTLTTRPEWGWEADGTRSYLIGRDNRISWDPSDERYPVPVLLQAEWPWLTFDIRPES